MAWPTAQQLMDQVPSTACFYLERACSAADAQFGEGYAAKHPELIAGFMITCAIDLTGAVIARAIEETLAESLRSDHPLMGETLGGLDAIADAIRDHGKEIGR